MKIQSTTVVKPIYFQAMLFVTLITLCTAATLAAQPEETNKPDARQATVPHPDLKAFPPAKAGM